MTQIIANGISLEFEQRGNLTGPAIILVRGLGTQLIDWPENLLQGLADLGFRVIVFDNRDVGLSEKLSGVPDLKKVASGEELPPYTLADMADDIVGLMDSLDIGQAHVFAISMGGMIGQVLAATHGERLLSFFSVMSSSSRRGFPSATPEAMAILNAEFDPDAGDEAIIAATARGLEVCGSPGYPTSPAQRLVIARRRFERNYTPDGVTRQMAAVIAGGDRLALLASIKVPTLVIHGRDDPLIRLEAGADTAQSIPGARLEVIAGMGHDLPDALMPKMLELINEFVNEVVLQTKVSKK